MYVISNTLTPKEMCLVIVPPLFYQTPIPQQELLEKERATLCNIKVC